MLLEIELAFQIQCRCELGFHRLAPFAGDLNVCGCCEYGRVFRRGDFHRAIQGAGQHFNRWDRVHHGVNIGWMTKDLNITARRVFKCAFKIHPTFLGDLQTRFRLQHINRNA